MKITNKAQEYSDMFTTGTRDNGKMYVYLKGNVLGGNLYDSIKEAHGDGLPSDFVFGTYADLLQKITEYDLDSYEDLQDVRSEIVDGYVDIYTKGLTEWLNADIDNVSYLTQVLEQGLELKDGYQLLAQAQYMAIDEVMESVVNLLNK